MQRWDDEEQGCRTLPQRELKDDVRCALKCFIKEHMFGNGGGVIYGVSAEPYYPKRDEKCRSIYTCEPHETVFFQVNEWACKSDQG